MLILRFTIFPLKVSHFRPCKLEYKANFLGIYNMTMPVSGTGSQSHRRIA